MATTVPRDAANDPWTIRRLLSWAATDFTGRGIPTGRLDAELLVAHALGLTRVGLYLDLDRPLDDTERERIRELVVRRRAREPIAYILGRKEFYGRDFEVSSAVLVPRPDTETLIERALSVVRAEEAARIVDLCTGSGAIGVTLAAERPASTVLATDISADALAVAERNAQAHGVQERVRFRAGDLFDALTGEPPFDLVVANPPYIADDELDALSADVHHEPTLALRGGAHGLAIVERLLADAPQWMTEGGTMLLEIGAGQAEILRAMLEQGSSYEAPSFHRDLGGIERVLELRRAL